jgi:site-specific DNA-methyltransferase (adenine-specific)
MNQLFYGDNLRVLRDDVKDETVDLVYLDPPFNSAANYNVLFREATGEQSAAQITAFEDTWHWTHESEGAYQELVTDAPERLARLIEAMRQMLGTSDMMAYLVMMAPRLVELHRVLKPTGSIYLHCDPTASHYLKLVMDGIFSPQNFCNHITWQRSDTHNDARKRFPAISDHILLYRKSDKQLFNKQFVPHADKTLQDWYQYLELSDGTVRRMTKEERESQRIPAGSRRFNTGDMTSPNPRPNLMYEYKGYPHPQKGWRYSRERMEELDSQGLLLFPSSKEGRIMLKRYLDEQEGVTVGDVWTDISQIRAAMAERLGYPTQKPEALLERIINASSNEGDVVLDPFCGCGTTITVAEHLKRRWLGIDITHLAVALIRSRLNDTFGTELSPYEVHGTPTDTASAEALALQDRYQFQWWALSLIDARPAQDKKKGKDTGIDGYIRYLEREGEPAKTVIVQVKSGKVSSRDIRDLVGVLDREKAVIGIFLTLQPPTRDMTKEAISAGFYNSQWGNFPRLQILTIEDLLTGKATAQYPRLNAATFKRAERKRRPQGEQSGLF